MFDALGKMWSALYSLFSATERFCIAADEIGQIAETKARELNVTMSIEATSNIEEAQAKAAAAKAKRQPKAK